MRFLLAILIWCCALEVSLALSYGTPSSMLAWAMASYMGDMLERDKKVPQTWEEMEVLFGAPMDEKFPYVTPTRRYVFLTNDVHLTSDFSIEYWNVVKSVRKR